MSDRLMAFPLFALFFFFYATAIVGSPDVGLGLSVLVLGVFTGLTFRYRQTIRESLSQDVSERRRDVLLLVSVVFAGVLARLALAVAYCPALKSDGLMYWRYVTSWSRGDFIETKSYGMTLVYGLVQFLFGPSLRANQVVNAFLGGVLTWGAYDLCLRLFRSRFAALTAGVLVAFHPGFLLLTLGLKSELLFGVFCLLAFRELHALLQDLSAGKGAVRRSILFALYSLGAFYTRGNGIFLLVAAGPVFLVTALRHRESRLSAVRSLLAFVTTCGSVMVSVGCVNRIVIGHFIVSSSEDSSWPVLYGTSWETKGRCNHLDKQRIKAAYRARHPGERFDLHKALPLIREEFVRRWKASPRSMLSLGVYKYRHMWCNREGCCWTLWFNEHADTFERTARRICKKDFAFRRHASLLACCSVPLLGFMGGPQRRLFCVLLTFLFLNVINHFFVEATPRYSFPLMLLLPVVAPGCLVVLSVLKGSRKKE